jgi:hypothetical protein
VITRTPTPTDTPTETPTITPTATPTPLIGCCDYGADANCTDPKTVGWDCPDGTLLEDCVCIEVPAP